MIWPPASICERITKLWALAHGSPNPGESANALAALKRLQSEFDLSDTALAFVAEYTAKEPTGSRALPLQDPPERPVNVLELILHLLNGCHIMLSLEQMFAVTLWTLHTHVFELFLHTPRLLLHSSEPMSGKTLLLMFLKQLVRDPLKTSNMTTAVIYYQLKEFPFTTFLVDETEWSVALWGKDTTFIQMFDAGHRQGGCVHRVLGIKGVGRKVVEFSVFCPIALAGVVKREYPRQMLTRSISIWLQQDPEGRDELLMDDPRFTSVRGFIFEWVASFRRPSDCVIPFTVRDRDNWTSLIEIADSLGYGATARAVAQALYHPIDDPTTRLLFDIRRVFDGPPRLDSSWTPDLLQALHGLEDWDEFWGLDGNQDPHKLRRPELYRLLKGKGIRSRTVTKTVDGKRVSFKGFYRSQFELVWQQLFGAGAPAQASKIIKLPRRE